MEITKSAPPDPHPLEVAATLVGGRPELAQLLGVSVSAIGNWKFRGVPFEQCMPIERAAGGLVTRRMLRPDDWQEHWPELTQAQAERAPAATELIAVATAAIDAVLHRAEDRIDELKKDAQVEIKLTSVEVRGEIEKDAHQALGRLGAPKPWNGENRRVEAPAADLPWNGAERRSGVERRQPEVLEAPLPVKPA